MNWYAIYTKPKAEDFAAQLLVSAGIETISPKIRIKKYFRKKYVDVTEQLFPCYIFASFEPERHGHMIRYTRGVRYIVGKEHPLPVPDEIIRVIRERMDEGVVRPEVEEFESGDRVLIKEGHFKDFYGIFTRNLTGKERAMILLDAIYCRLEIEVHYLKKV